MSAGAAYHGGAFWETALWGETELIPADVVVADVLDAWFPPAPLVVSRLQESMAKVSRVSPPTFAEPLVARLTHQFGLAPDQCVLGPGSSALIFTALRQLLAHGQRTLLMDPTYSEYRHVLGLLGSHVTTFRLSAEAGFRIQIADLVRTIEENQIQGVILVNPNNPTGTTLDLGEIQQILRALPSDGLLWVDETYQDYLENPASLLGQDLDPRVLVLKSFSKVFALSGLRVGALFGSGSTIAAIRQWIPPWFVSLPALIALDSALDSLDYYAAMLDETRRLRHYLTSVLPTAYGRVVASEANFVLLEAEGETASRAVRRCAEHRVYVRNAHLTSQTLSDRTIRIAVRSRPEIDRIVEVLGNGG